METRQSDWEEVNYFTSEQLSDMALKTYIYLLTSGRRYNKETKDSHILDLVGVTQKLSDDSKKSSEKFNTSNRESTKGELDYTRDLPPWMLEDPKCGVRTQQVSWYRAGLLPIWFYISEAAVPNSNNYQHDYRN